MNTITKNPLARVDNLFTPPDVAAAAFASDELAHVRIDKRKAEIAALDARMKEIETLLSLWAMAEQRKATDPTVTTEITAS